MNSSGIKRGLAATAVSALAVAGLPFLANSASATPLQDQGLAATEVALLTQGGEAGVIGISAKDDGTNTSVSLVAKAGASVTSVLFQYEVSGAPGVWTSAAAAVARGADGAFSAEFVNPPAGVTGIRAVAGPSGDISATGVIGNLGAAGNTVELASEGTVGVFQEPYTEGPNAATASDLVGVTGTVSQGAAAPTVNVSSPAGTLSTDVTTLETTTSTTSDTFNSVLDIDGYSYSGGTEPNQIAINATTSNTDDVEASTLAVQTIGSITATPETQDNVDPNLAEVTLTVLDTANRPVAGAQVFVGGDTDSDGAGADTDVDGAETLVGYTDGRGVIKDVDPNGAVGAATFTYYVNTTDGDGFEPAVDKSDTATVTTYTAALTSVLIKNERSRTAFDLDELSDNDDFTIQTLDQKGAIFEENIAGDDDIEYRYVVDPDGAAPAVTSAWIGAETTAGSFTVPALTNAFYAGIPGVVGQTGALPNGSYTIEARRPNVGGTGLTNATPVTFKAGESEITFAEGTSANATVEGDTTQAGTLALWDGTALPGRAIRLSFVSGRIDSVFVDATGAADADVSGLTAVAVTGTDGGFSVKLDDPAGPEVVPDVPESPVINAIAEETLTDSTPLQGANGATDDTDANEPAPNPGYLNAEANLTVNFAAAPTVVAIEINDSTIYGDYAPGRPADLDVTVFAADGPDGGTAPDVINDAAVTIAVDKGFLSDDIGAGDEDDLVLDAAHSTPGGLWGYFKNNGTSVTSNTGDGGASAGATVAIEKDSGFDDDGMVDIEVTVTSGAVTETETLQFTSGDPINVGSLELNRAAGEPTGDVTVGEELGFNLLETDQFGNLVGGEFASISDDSTVADVDTDGDFGGTLTDFTTSGVGINATSTGPTVQTLLASIGGAQETVIDTAGDPDDSNYTAVASSDPINWVAAPVVKVDPKLVVSGSGGKTDKVKADAIGKAAGAKATLWVGGVKKKTGTLNSSGNFTFSIKDKNGNKTTKYVVKIAGTSLTLKDQASKKIK